MTTIPVTILDDFFDNPYTIRDWALSLEYFPHPDSRWVGRRTHSLQEIHPIFYKYVCKKILSLFFPVSKPTNSLNLEFNCRMHFQLIEDYNYTGWIHQDIDQFTSIIYLSEENNINCGTSLYKLSPNHILSIESQQDLLSFSLKNKHYKNKTLSKEDLKLKNDYENKFDKILDVNDKFNRLLCFSSEIPHSANYFSNNISPRLTLICFFDDIQNNSAFPIVRSKQTIPFD